MKDRYKLFRFKPEHKWTLGVHTAVGEEAENTEPMTYEQALAEQQRRNAQIDADKKKSAKR